MRKFCRFLLRGALVGSLIPRSVAGKVRVDF